MYRLSCANIQPRYQFTKDNSLVEVAKLLVSMGADAYKFSLNPASVGITGLTNVKTLRDVVSLVPAYKYVLDMPELKHYVCWAYSIGGAIIKNGFTSQQQEYEYKQVYDLTCYLLTTYSGSGKTFYLGNWESDWGALGITSFDSLDPPASYIRDLTAYFTIRQKAVDDAKIAMSGKVSNVNVFHYAEVVMVKEALNNPVGSNKRCVNAVIPNVPDLDFVSWSAHTTQDDDKCDVHMYLDYIESCMQKKTRTHVYSLYGSPEGLGKRVFIGEFGWMHLDGVVGAQHHATFLYNVFSWGCPFAFFWQMYGGGVNTYCLIKPDGSQDDAFWLYKSFMSDPKLHVLEDFIRVSDSSFTYKRNTTNVIAQSTNMDVALYLQDGVRVDLNGYDMKCNGIFNLGSCVRVENTSTSLSTLTIGGTCTFGCFANNWLSGYKNGKGNACIQGNIDVVIRGQGVFVTFDAANNILGRVVIDGGATLIAKSPSCLRGCTEIVIKDGSLQCCSDSIFGDTAPLIRVTENATQIICKVSDVWSNTIVIEGGRGASGRGLIETTGQSTMRLTGDIKITQSPVLGGIIGGNVAVAGRISCTSVPFTIRRGSCCIESRCDVQQIHVQNGTLQLSNENVLPSTCDIVMGSQGNAVIQVLRPQSFQGIRIATQKYQSSISNPTGNAVVVTTRDTIYQLLPGMTITLQ